MTPIEVLQANSTPGFTYAIAYCMTCVMFSLFLPVRSRGPGTERMRRIFISCLIFVCICSFMILTDGIETILFVPCMMLIFFLQFCYFFALLDVSWEKAAYFTLQAFIHGEFSASLSWQLLYYAFTRGILPSLLWIQVVGGAVISFLVTLAVYWIHRHFREADAQLEISRKDLLIAGIISLSVYVLSNLSYMSASSPFSSHYVSETFIIRTLTDLCGCGLLYAYHAQIIEVRVRAEMQSIEQMLHMQYEQYELSRESVELVEQKYHDLKHQILLLRSEISSQDKLDFLGRMEEEIRSFEAQNKTGNQVLDTILTAKSIQCQKQGITLTAVADGKELAFMDSMDISALFGNALDNAMESVRKLSSPDRRLIHLSVVRQKGFVSIRVENCYDGNLRVVGGVLQTTKQDRRYHGFGLKSIQKIAEKYGGSCTTQVREGWFELRVLLSAPGGARRETARKS